MYLQWLTIFRDTKTVLLLLLGLLLTTYLIKKFSRNPRWVLLSKKLSGPYELPIVGNTFHLLLGTIGGVEPYLSHCHSNYGSTFRLWIGNHLLVVVSEAADIEVIEEFQRNFGSAEPFISVILTAIPSLQKAWTQKSGIMATVSNWKHKRKAFQPFFTKNHSLSQIPIMNKIIYEYIDELKTWVDGPERDWKDATSDLSLKTFNRLYLTVNDNPNMEELKDMIYRLSRVMEMFSASALLNFPTLVDIWNRFLPSSLPELKKLVKRYIDEVVDFNKKQAANFAEKKGGDHDNHSAFVLSFMDTLERIQKELDEDDLVYNESMALLVAGSETTGATIAGCLFALAALPEIQDKVYEEIYQVFGEDDRPADISDLEKLSYLEQVIKETQRLFTVVPVVIRQTQSDTKIGPHIYPAGTSVMVNLGGVHHDPKLYPNPYSFHPDNFSTEAIKNRHRCSFVPFSGGARNCIGKILAEISMKLIMTALLRTFVFHTTKKIENVKLKPGLVEGIAFGYPLSITLRKKSISFK